MTRLHELLKSRKQDMEAERAYLRANWIVPYTTVLTLYQLREIFFEFRKSLRLAQVHSWRRRGVMSDESYAYHVNKARDIAQAFPYFKNIIKLELPEEAHLLDHIRKAEQ